MSTVPPAEAFCQRTLGSLRDGTFVRLWLSAPADRTQSVERITGRLVEIQGGVRLSLTLSEARRATTKNLPVEEVAAWLTGQLAGRFRSAVLETTAGQWQFTISSKGRPRLVGHQARTDRAPARNHDRAKAVWLDASAQPWLQALGLCDDAGRVRPSMAAKHQQLERYLEILSHLVRECGWTPDTSLKLADMGCGKGYLTFGVWHLLNRRLGLRASVLGVETRPDLVEQASQIARSVHAESLQFVAGDIATIPLDGLDALLALHACNTATDDALARGVRSGAKLMVVSPCCHQELRPKLGRPEPLAPLLGHGLLAERFSEWLADGLRVLQLEAAGYATKVIEFVGSEHTPRNLLLAGVRHEPGSALARKRSRKQVRLLKEHFQLGNLASDDIDLP